jgi:leukotriene-A4 hydrolase
VKFTFLVLAMAVITACNKPASSSRSSETPMNQPAESRKDPHSYSNPEQVRVKHISLDLDTDFAKKVFRGTATLDLERSSGYSGPLMLDTRALTIQKAESSSDGKTFADTRFELGTNDKIFGSPLKIELPANATTVRITYATSPEASGLLWLEPAQTAGKKHPFVFSQGQPIHTRSWVPCQDTPGVRMTYSARIRTPKELLAVMSAENDPNPKQRGDYTFKMPQAVPSYLMAIAVGDLKFAPLGPRTGVYAEPSVLPKAAKELEDTEKMVEAAESLYGPYAWGRYDLLILPPSFPFGGMENPRLTFATPTILAGDKSLVALVSHELAHSWSGNLVTNATWADFWLNEGFTTYFERRIQEKVYGRARSEMEAMVERTEMLEEMKTLAPRDQILHVNLNGRDPDEGFSQIPYVKGMLFLRLLEELYGRPKFDAFLKGYFDKFKFQSIDTATFVEYLKANLLNTDPALAKSIDLEEWIEKPGLPDSAPRPSSDALAKVSRLANQWLSQQTQASELPARQWTTQEWLHFLQSMPEKLGVARMAELDRAFNLTQSGNAEILNAWLVLAIRNGYNPAYPKLQEFLVEVGRRKFVKPLFTELVKTPEGKELARRIYAKAKPGYHSMVVSTVDPLVN